MTSAVAGPRRPTAGNGPQPSVSAPDSATWSTLAAINIRAGTAMFPVPRSTDAKVLASHIATAPPNAISA